MLGQIPSYDENQFIKSIEIGDLSMRTKNKTVNNNNQTKLLQQLGRPPERSLTTPWVLSNLGFFRIHLTIVGPIPEKPERYLHLSGSKAKNVLEAMTNLIEALKKELG